LACLPQQPRGGIAANPSLNKGGLKVMAKAKEAKEPKRRRRSAAPAAEETAVQAEPKAVTVE
jgi:hypothetical protein